MNISIVIPAYNESEAIETTIQEIFSTLSKSSVVKQIEIIVVDDHSSDNTFGIVKNISDERVRCLRLSRRCGSHIALRAGIKESSGDAVLCISADGQDDLACLADMLEKWHRGAKVVWACRKDRKNEPWYIRVSSILFYKLLMLLKVNRNLAVDLSRADFYLLDKTIVNAINACNERNTSLFGLILWLGFKQDCVEYERRARRHGKSKWDFRSRFNLAKDWIVAFSGLPLRFMAIFGFLVAVIGLLYALDIFINALIGHPASGWSSIMIVILVVGGVQMMMLGVIGEYLWRNLDESRMRPLYLIEKRSDDKYH